MDALIARDLSETFAIIQDEGSTIMSKPLKAALIALLMITASVVFMWDSNAIASKSAQASEKPKPTQARVTDLRKTRDSHLFT